MVKLYDLTDYCKNEIMEGDNPFTVPVGLLCHRVGSNLKRTGQRRMADARAMFENCLRLLDDAKHAQVRTPVISGTRLGSACFLLSFSHF